MKTMYRSIAVALFTLGTLGVVSPAQAGVGWIDRIYNNSSKVWYIKSLDARHNGLLKAGSETIELNGGKFHPLLPKTQYNAEWCGLPWYADGKHYKVLTTHEDKGGLEIFTSELSGGNRIVFIDQEGDSFGRQKGAEFMRQAAPTGSDFHCFLRIEDDGIYIDIINNNKFSGENLLYEVLKEGKWVIEQGVQIAAAAAGAGS